MLFRSANISWCEDFIFNLEYLRHCHTIYALQAPVYYYVKTKGSLVNSQGTSINNTIRMKLNVFEYYQQFYREVYDEKSYEEIRFQVYRFLLTYAKDGFVPPSFLPGSRKLGQERLTAVLPEALEGDSIALDYYCCRKLWERYCEITAVKNDMTLDEVQVLVYLNQEMMIYDLKQLSNLTGFSVRKLGSVVQKLEKRQMIRKVNTKKETKSVHRMPQRHYELLPEAAPALHDLALAEKDFNEVWLRNLSEMEKADCRKLFPKIRESIKSFLRV